MQKIEVTTQNNFLNELLLGNKSACSLIVKTLLNKNIEFYTIYEELLKKSLYKVGELWEFNKISVATEHLASAIVEGILNEIYLKLIFKKSINKNVLLSCVEKEYHQIGAKMICDVFEVNGWNSYFLGANVPTKDVLLFSKTIEIDLIAISFSIYFHLSELLNLIDSFRNDFPNTPILVGGQGFRHGGENELLKFKNVFYLSDIRSVEKYIKELKNGY